MTQVEALEQQLGANKFAVEMRDMAIKLSENREFRKLILEGFCEKECARYARESGDPSLTAEQRQDALNMAQAAGHLKRFLSVIFVTGNTAQNQISEIEFALEEIRTGANENSEEGDE